MIYDGFPLAVKGLKEWWSHANTSSIDGLPSLSSSFLSHDPLKSTIPDPKVSGMLPDSHKSDDAGDIALSTEEIEEMKARNNKKSDKGGMMGILNWLWMLLGGNDSKTRTLWAFLAGVMLNNLISFSGKNVRGYVGY